MTQTSHDKQCKFLARCEEAYHLVQDFLHDRLPEVEKNPPFIFRQHQRSIVKEKVKKSLEVLDKALDSHSVEEIALSYNGGKDCLVMLILLMASIHKKFSSESVANPKLNLLPKDYRLDSIFINSETSFPELTEFIKSSTHYYQLNPITIKSSLKEGFEHYLNEVNTKIKVIVVGIRYADPYGSQLSYEQETDHNWPKFLRVHPILHWHYVDVWEFLIACDLPYCSLYDDGYTSLGGVETTERNMFLRVGDSYLPAYMLEEYADERERVGRKKNLT